MLASDCNSVLPTTKRDAIWGGAMQQLAAADMHCSRSPDQERQADLGQDCRPSCPPPPLASPAHGPADKHQLSMPSNHSYRGIG